MELIAKQAPLDALARMADRHVRKVANLIRATAAETWGAAPAQYALTR